MSSPNYSTSPPYSPNNQNYVSPYTRPINQSISPQYHPNGNNQYLPIHPGSLSSDRTESLTSPMSPSLASPVPNQQQERITGSMASINSLKESPQLSPVFKSEAAKQIIKEMSAEKTDSPRRRPIPKEKRRHYTVSSSKPMLDLEDNFSKMVPFLFFFYFFLCIFSFILFRFFVLLIILYFFSRYLKYFFELIIYIGIIVDNRRWAVQETIWIWREL